MPQEIVLVHLLVLTKSRRCDVLHDFLKFSSVLAECSVLYGLVRSVPLFIVLGSLASVRADSTLSVLHAEGNLSKRARNNGDAAVANARPWSDMEKILMNQQQTAQSISWNLYSIAEGRMRSARGRSKQLSAGT